MENSRMSLPAPKLDDLISREYRHGFVTDVEADALPRGLSEDVVRLISAKKNEPAFMLEWRLAAFRHWRTMTEPGWATVRHPKIDYQDIIYYSAPKSGKTGPKSLDEVDPELLRVYEKLGVPLKERELLAGVALGAILGSIGFLRITMWSAFSDIYGPHWLLVATTVGMALIGVVLWGGLVGSLLPFLLRRIGFDPATSSAPFVATLVDVTGLVIYFSVALVLLRGTLL